MKTVAALIFVLGIAAGGTAANGQPCPMAELIDCTPIQNCERAQDDKDCNRCLFKNPLGGCFRAIDPACEAAKVQQKAAYDIERAKCENDRDARKAKCEAAKAAVQRAAAECAKQK